MGFPCKAKHLITPIETGLIGYHLMMKKVYSLNIKLCFDFLFLYKLAWF